MDRYDTDPGMANYVRTSRRLAAGSRLTDPCISRPTVALGQTVGAAVNENQDTVDREVRDTGFRHGCGLHGNDQHR
jgi:hypothetical protein